MATAYSLYDEVLRDKLISGLRSLRKQKQLLKKQFIIKLHTMGYRFKDLDSFLKDWSVYYEYRKTIF